MSGVVKRKIEPDMIAFIDNKLKENGLAQEAIANKDARTLLVQAASACVGIREVGGNNQGPMVKLIQETIGGADGEAWCMSFVQTMVAYCDAKCGTVSPLFVSEGCAQVWDGTPKTKRVKQIPAPGAVIIWGKYGPMNKKGKRSYLGGHTGIVTSYFTVAKKMMAVEGNTEAGLNKAGDVERDGGGVYSTTRHTVKNGKMEVRGFLKPW